MKLVRICLYRFIYVLIYGYRKIYETFCREVFIEHHKFMCTYIITNTYRYNYIHLYVNIGEFRLWNIYVKERTSEATFVPTLQVFNIMNSEIPYNRIKFLAIPYSSSICTSYYSDIISCSSKLMHFLPEKNAKDFSPPTSCMFHDR